MVKKITTLLIIVLACFAVFFLLKPANSNQSEPKNLPWQIKTFTDGTSQVFGLNLEKDSLSKALQHLGIDHELAVIADQQNYAALEVYFSHFFSGPLKGKLIIVVDAPEKALAEIQDNPAASKYMASGARQFSLNDQDLARAQHWPIKSLSFIPAVNLSEDIAKQRFGEPDEILAEGESTQHFLYEAIGVDVVINTEAKDQIFYVAPRSFSELKNPLEALE